MVFRFFWQPIKFHSQNLSFLLASASAFLHTKTPPTKNASRNGGTRTKSRRREKFVEFYPVSRYSIIIYYVFFLSLSLQQRAFVVMMICVGFGETVVSSRV